MQVRILNGLMGLIVAAWAQAGNAVELKLLPPTNGIYHGTFPDTVETEGAGQVLPNTRSYEQLAGNQTAYVILGNPWYRGIRFPADQVREVQKLNKLPLVQIMPWVQRRRDDGPDPVFHLRKIVSGRFDGDLRRYAADVQANGKAIALSFAPEMNGSWHPWSGLHIGAGTSTEYGDPAVADGPELYRDAYRHVVTLFRQAGVQNVTWFFHFTAINRPNQSWNAAEQYYPGDAFVDWVGVSSYSAQQTRDMWEDFTVLVDDAYAAFERMTTSKPFAVLEFGTIEDPLNRYRKADWISNALSAINAGRYPRLKAISYWHERSWDAADDSFNMRIDSSRVARDAFVEGLRGGRFISTPQTTKPTESEIFCYCGFVPVNGVSNCAVWRPGDQLLKEYRRLSSCTVNVCQQLFSASTQQYCGGKYKAYP